MLYLVGLGLWDEKDITIRGLEIAKKAKSVYLEAYTSYPMGMKKDKLEKMLGKSVRGLSRRDVEGEAEFIEEARENDVVVLVGGDPLVATTHSDIILRAKELNIDVRVVHNASIVSAIAETGLHIYKFGQTITIPFWTENFRPKSFYDKLVDNKERGLHTLVLLDIDRENNRYMSANEGLRRLIDIDKKNVVEQAFVIARLGGPDQVIVFGDAKKLVDMDFGGPLHAIVVPGQLHISEKDYIERIIRNL